MRRGIWNKVLSMLTALLLVIGIAPMTATTTFAAGEDAPATLYVGNQQVIKSSSTTYWTTDNSGGLTLVDDATDANDWTVRYNPNTATLTLKDATIETTHTQSGAVIYAESAVDSAVSLTINLEGTNKIECNTASYGIYVNAEMASDSYGTDASLTITGTGSLAVSGSTHGIWVKSGSGNASLTINSASVEANTSTDPYSAGVNVQSSTNASVSPNLSLAVNGGSLTASGGTSSDGIQFYVSNPDATNAITSLTVTGNAIVDAKNGGISALRILVPLPTPTPTGENSSGIVFDGTEGTVYGNVTLDESLTINQGETLTIPEGSTLNSNDNLTNNGTIVNTGGTLNGEPGGIIVTAPAITTESLPEGTVNQLYSATLEVTGNNITWSLDSGTLPDGLTLDSNGTIAGTPTAAGTSTFTVTATNDAGSASKEYTLTIKAVSVTSLKLNKDSLTLQERGSDTLTATVEPADATNQDVTWKSSDTSIATVSADGTVTAISAGTATITATAKDGSGVSASCTLTVTHGKMVQTPKKDATCTVDGTEEYWMCEICGKHFEDESGTIPTTPEENKIQATGHSYGEPVWNWSEDGKTCTVTFTCEKDETHKETPKVIVTSAEKTPGTCTEAGVTTYTATVQFNGNTYTDTKDVADIPATGHSYGEPVWSWAEDGKTCKVTFTCEKDENHKKTPEVKVTSAVKTPATCTEKGVTTYTATVEFNGKTYTDTKDLTDIPTTGHSYGEPVWNWSEDGKTCTVTFICEKDETHKETPKVKITSVVKTPATCTEAGVTTYTATVEFNGKTYTDTKDLADIPAIGHKLTKTEAKAPTSTDTGNIEYWYCKVCDKYFSDEKAEHEITLEDTIIAKLPKLISGANQEWTKGSKDGLTFKVDTDINEFKKVLVDGKELKDTNYDIKSGSTILTLKSSFLDTLSAGKHQICLEFNNGTIEAYFTVKVKETTTVPETGEQTNLYLWAMLAIASSASILVLRRYKKYNR